MMKRGGVPSIVVYAISALLEAPHDTSASSSESERRQYCCRKPTPLVFQRRLRATLSTSAIKSSPHGDSRSTFAFQRLIDSFVRQSNFWSAYDALSVGTSNRYVDDASAFLFGCHDDECANVGSGCRASRRRRRRRAAWATSSAASRWPSWRNRSAARFWAIEARS